MSNGNNSFSHDFKIQNQSPLNSYAGYTPF